MQSYLHRSITKSDRSSSAKDDGVLYYVNKGFPIDDNTWERMWKYVAKLNPNDRSLIESTRDNDHLPEQPIPSLPVLKGSLSVQEQLEAVQKYMSSLEYNHTGTQFFDIRKNRPICGQVEAAKEIISESLPIKCLEAVILGLYLTIPLETVERFPISFHSYFLHRTYRHVVLGVYHSGKYGALGMSRRKNLMYKELKYRSLSELILNYIQAYQNYCHEVKKVKIGLLVSHDAHSYEQISWKYCSLFVPDFSKEELCRRIDKHSRMMRSKTTGHALDAISPIPPQKSLYESSKSLSKSHSEGLGNLDTTKKFHNKVHTTNYQLRV